LAVDAARAGEALEQAVEAEAGAAAAETELALDEAALAREAQEKAEAEAEKVKAGAEAAAAAAKALKGALKNAKSAEDKEAAKKKLQAAEDAAAQELALAAKVAEELNAAKMESKDAAKDAKKAGNAAAEEEAKTDDDAEGKATLSGYSVKPADDSEDLKVLWAFLLMTLFMLVILCFLTYGFDPADWWAILSCFFAPLPDEEGDKAMKAAAAGASKTSDLEDASRLYATFTKGSMAMVSMDADRGYSFVSQKDFKSKSKAGDCVPYTADAVFHLAVPPLDKSTSVDIIYVQPKKDTPKNLMTDPELIVAADCWAYLVFFQRDVYEMGIMHEMGWREVNDSSLKEYCKHILPEEIDNPVLSAKVAEDPTSDAAKEHDPPQVMAKLFRAYEPIFSRYPGESKIPRALFITSDPIIASWNWYTIASGATFVLATVWLVVGIAI